MCSPTPPSRGHWRRVWATNPLERVNKQIKRRSNAVGILPNDAVAVRLIGVVLMEVHDEWQIAERGYFSKHSIAQLHATSDDDHGKEATTDSHTALPAA